MIWASAISFIVILGILVLVHELGHFLSARAFRVGVEEFGFGFILSEGNPQAPI